MALRWLGIVVLVVGLATTPGLAGKKKQPDVVTPADLIKLMEKSKVQYVISPTKELKGIAAPDFADVLWPPKSQGLHMPYVRKGENGSASLVTYPESEASTEALNAVEPAFQAKDYAAAATGYLEVLQKYPDMYRAHLYLGDAYFLGPKDNDKALAEYREAIRLNPYDAVGYAFAGHALVKLRKNDEALDAWVRALALRPYHETTMKLASQFGQTLGVKPYPDRFRPRALVRREGDKVALYIDMDDGGTHWMSWAVCKAVWLAEPDYRQQRGVTGDNLWSSAEDYECMMHLLIMYDLGRKDGTAKEEPELERLRGLLADKLLDEYVIYEFGSRASADATLLVPSDSTDFEKYVRTYVLPKRPVSTAVPAGN